VSRISKIACQDCERDFLFDKDEDKAGSFLSFFQYKAQRESVSMLVGELPAEDDVNP